MKWSATNTNLMQAVNLVLHVPWESTKNSSKICTLQYKNDKKGSQNLNRIHVT